MLTEKDSLHVSLLYRLLHYSNGCLSLNINILSLSKISFKRYQAIFAVLEKLKVFNFDEL